MTIKNVCPSKNLLLYRLLGLYPDYVASEGLAGQVGSMLTRQQVQDEINQRDVPSFRSHRAQPLFDPCLDAQVSQFPT